jgi:hypothetical protein
VDLVTDADQVLGGPSVAMLGSEERGEMDLGRSGENLGSLAKLPIDSGSVRDKPDALAAEKVEVLASQHLQAAQDRHCHRFSSRANDRAGPADFAGSADLRNPAVDFKFAVRLADFW